MENNELVSIIKKDHDKLLEMLSTLEKGEGDIALRDKFLDGWVDYSMPIGLVIYDSIHSKVPNGDEILNAFRKETERVNFKQVFADLENAKAEELKTVATKAAPVFRFEAERLLKDLVPYLVSQLEAEEITDIIKRYRKVRQGS